MSETSEFTVIPALDLKDGLVVHAKAGNRADYRPIASPFGAADEPAAIAQGLLTASGSPILYIADLDAIGGTGDCAGAGISRAYGVFGCGHLGADWRILVHPRAIGYQAGCTAGGGHQYTDCRSNSFDQSESSVVSAGRSV